MEHSKLPWKQGILLDTARTRKLDKMIKEKYEAQESLRVFSGFTALDQGRSRRQVALCTSKEDAKYIVKACNAYPKLVEALKFISNPDTEPEYHPQAMGCGLEDGGITNRYEAMRYGWEQAIDGIREALEMSEAEALLKELGEL